MQPMSMEDARLDHLTLRLDSLHDQLLNRADQLDEASKNVGLKFSTVQVLQAMANEFRALAGSLE